MKVVSEVHALITNMKALISWIFFVAVFFSLPAITNGDENAGRMNVQPVFSPDEVENQIKPDRGANPLYESRILAPIREWRDGVGEKAGFNWSLDYSPFFVLRF